MHFIAAVVVPLADCELIFREEAVRQGLVPAREGEQYCFVLDPLMF